MHELHNNDLSDRIKPFQPLSVEEIDNLILQIDDWTLNQYDSIIKIFNFSKFMDVIHFVNWTAGLAEKLNHHPNMYIRYKTIEIEIYTHNISALSLADFVLAKKIMEYFK